MTEPSYIKLFHSGELERRVVSAEKILQSCTSCPRNCKVNRTANEFGTCQSGSKPVVSSYTPHFGEEPLLSGTKGAGNIFFGNCNLRCDFCQNFIISQNPKEENKLAVSTERLSEIMLELQNLGCHNIGLVSPTHFAVPILSSIYSAVKTGLKLPIIYNTNGYDSVEILKLYEDVVDIYLPDLKYGSNDAGRKYSKAPGYFEYAKSAVKEMYRQVGSELIIGNGVLVRGLIVRHLILPNNLADTEEVFKFISQLDKKICISLMTQYFPTNKANTKPLLNRNINFAEYYKAMNLLDKYGLENGWVQELESENYYRPQFEQTRIEPFTK